MPSEPSQQAVLYAAKSSPDEKGSIPDQLADCRALAEQGDYEVAPGGEYAEENVSAYHGDRGAELARAIEHVAELGGVLIVWHSDRLARGDGQEARHLIEIFIEARRRGFQITSVEDPTTFDSLLTAVVMGDRNHEDSRRKGGAVKKGHERRHRNGKPSGPRSYGYRLRRIALDDESRSLVIEPAEATIVSRIQDEFLAGTAQLAIARKLEAECIATAEGGRWYQSTVRRILCNPIYAGLVRDGDKLVEGAHEAITTREKWDRIQGLITAKKARVGRGRKPAGAHLFRKGHLRCGECGGAMIPRTDSRSGTETYRCHVHWHDPAACSQGPVPRAEIDTAVFNYFSAVSLDVEATRDQMLRARDAKLGEVRELLRAAEFDVAAAEDALTRVETDYVRGKVDVDTWQALKAGRLDPELAAAESKRDRLSSQFADIEQDASLRDAEAEVIEQLARLRAAVAGEVDGGDGADAVRAVLVRVFDQFILHRSRPEQVEADLICDAPHWLEPVANPKEIEGYDEELQPIVGRKPLPQAVNNSDRDSIRSLPSGSVKKAMWQTPVSKVSPRNSMPLPSRSARAAGTSSTWIARWPFFCGAKL